MFRDEVRIQVKGGRGGDGCASFRREKFVPRGGPWGGDGGRGGDVIVRAAPHQNTLLAVSRKTLYAAENGRPGQGKNRKGGDGADVVIEVPVGTLVRDDRSGERVRDLTQAGDEVIVARGGEGGLGNCHFAAPDHRTPREWTPGAEGEERWIHLELKLIADVGLVGLPNAGKSTLLARLSRATPRIADYPFTTLVPQLGIVLLPGWRTFVLADLPGLIEGAHLGVGLGDRFLRHIERTRLLVHLVDMAPPAGLPSPPEALRIVRRELRAYSPDLAARPEIVAPAKMDVPPAPEALEALRREAGSPLFPISAVTGEGLEALLAEIDRRLFPAAGGDSMGGTGPGSVGSDRSVRSDGSRGPSAPIRSKP
jgi:GTP-binding protein